MGVRHRSGTGDPPHQSPERERGVAVRAITAGRWQPLPYGRGSDGFSRLTGTWADHVAHPTGIATNLQLTSAPGAMGPAGLDGAVTGAAGGLDSGAAARAERVAGLHAG